VIIRSKWAPPPPLPEEIQKALPGLSVRARRAILFTGAQTVDELARLAPKAFWECPSLGVRTVQEICERLETVGCRLGDEPAVQNAGGTSAV
jgi:hypothetical protein